MKTTLLRNTLAAIATLFISMFALPQQAQAQTKEAYLVEDGTTLTFYYDANKASRTGTVYGIDQKRTDATWIPAWAGTYKDQNKRTTKVVFDASFRDYKPTNTSYWFNYCTKLATIEGMANLSTDQVTDMYGMFCGCEALTSLDVSNFNTTNVTNMGEMFRYCSALTSLDLSKFNTANVTNMNYMFDYCSALTFLNVSNFNTAKVTRMWFMFESCKALTSLDVSNFNTENVTGMRYMFFDCSALTSLDVSKFNTANVTDMAQMFGSCQALATIYCNDDWKSSTVENSTNMFKDCPKLKGAVPYDDAKTDVAMANPTTGYFTKKAPNGIAAVTTADTPQKKQGTYNLHGVKMQGTPDRLPAGIYIVDGKKVVKP